MDGSFLRIIKRYLSNLGRCRTELGWVAWQAEPGLSAPAFPSAVPNAHNCVGQPWDEAGCWIVLFPSNSVCQRGTQDIPLTPFSPSSPACYPPYYTIGLAPIYRSDFPLLCITTAPYWKSIIFWTTTLASYLASLILVFIPIVTARRYMSSTSLTLRASKLEDVFKI